jgi:hypothetical protein
VNMDIEKDYHAWIVEQIAALRERNYEALDLDNLAEEVEDLGRSTQHQITNRLETICEHLLKLQIAGHQVWPVRGWEATIRRSRLAVREALAESPSLRPRLEEFAAKAWGGARVGCIYDIVLPLSCPWTLEQLLDDNYWPPEYVSPRR